METKEKLYRVPVGPGKNHRAIYQIRDEALLILVVRVGDRERCTAGSSEGAKFRQAPRHTKRAGDAPPALLVLLFNCYGFEVLGFEDLAAIQAFQVFHAIAPGDDLGTVVLARVLLHKARLRIYSNELETLVKGDLHYFFES